MQKFQDLLTEAAQLKQQQLKQERKNFQALPEYLKSGLNYAKKYVQLRKQHYLVQKYISQKLKKQGNEQYLLQNYGQALSKYQQALSIFRYIHATKYENLKDEDIIYQNYRPQEEFKQEHDTHLVALYLNICSALTKMNKKDEALHSSEEALKINNNNPKIYYKKAQAFLQYINRDSSDIKLGFYYLNKAYELSKDQSILVQMHKIKKELDEQREKEKNWFKFMFDKNKAVNNNEEKSGTNSQTKKKDNQMATKNNTGQSKTENSPSAQNNQENKLKNEETKSNRMKQQMDQFRKQNQNHQDKDIPQSQKLQRTKLSLKPYLIIPRDDRWIIKYQQDFIHKHGSKIYSILQLYNHSDYLLQFKSLLAKCLQLKQAKITPQRDQSKLLQQKIHMYDKLIEWIKTHPLEKYKKYIQRYDLQTQWITNNRGKPLDQVYVVQQKSKHGNNKNVQKQREEQKNLKQIKSQKNLKLKSQIYSKLQQKEQKSTNTKQSSQNDQKQSQLKTKLKEGKKIQKDKNTQKNKKQNKSDKNKEFKFKQQWEYQYEKQQQKQLKEDQVPSNLKAYLQNYQQFPTFSREEGRNKTNQNQNKEKTFIKRQQTKGDSNPQQQVVKQNPLTFIKTFLSILVLVALFKIIF